MGLVRIRENLRDMTSKLHEIKGQSNISFGKNVSKKFEMCKFMHSCCFSASVFFQLYILLLNLCMVAIVAPQYPLKIKGHKETRLVKIDRNLRDETSWKITLSLINHTECI